MIAHCTKDMYILHTLMFMHEPSVKNFRKMDILNGDYVFWILKRWILNHIVI